MITGLYLSKTFIALIHLTQLVSNYLTGSLYGYAYTDVVCACVWVCACLCVCVCICVYLYVCVYVIEQFSFQ